METVFQHKTPSEMFSTKNLHNVPLVTSPTNLAHAFIQQHSILSSCATYLNQKYSHEKCSMRFSYM